MHVPYPPPFSDFSLKKTRAYSTKEIQAIQGGPWDPGRSRGQSPLSPPVSRLVVSAAQATDVVQLGRGVIVGSSHRTAEDLLRLAAPTRKLLGMFVIVAFNLGSNVCPFVSAITLMHRARTHLYSQPTHVRLSGQ